MIEFTRFYIIPLLISFFVGAIFNRSVKQTYEKMPIWACIIPMFNVLIGVLLIVLLLNDICQIVPQEKDKDSFLYRPVSKLTWINKWFRGEI